MSSLVKYRVKEVAADFGMQPKEIAEIVGKYFEKPKSNTQVLTDDELNLVFDYMTQTNQISSLEVVFAVAPAPKAEPKPEPAKEAPKAEAPKAAPTKEAPKAEPKQEKPEFFLELNGNVGLLTLTPGVKGEILDEYFRLYDAVVLSGYGTGGIPDGEFYGFYERIASWEGKGKTLVVTTQVQQEGSDMNVYQVGRGFKNRFALLESYSMTYESIITKLMWILAQTKEDEAVKKLFYKNINYDLIG